MTKYYLSLITTGFGGGGVSHNMLTEMSEIRQEEPSSSISSSAFSTSTKDRFFDDFEIVDADKVSRALDKVYSVLGHFSLKTILADLKEDIGVSCNF